MLSPEISIVTTLYRSENTIQSFIKSYIDVLMNLGISDYEFIVVNDGSPDNSLQKVLEFKKDLGDKLKVIDFSRNFGHHNALFAGMMFSKGEYVYLSDSDMEVNPDYLRTFYNIIKNNSNIDFVYGYLTKREDGVIGILSTYFWKFFSFMTGFRFEPNITTERVLKRKVCEAITSVGDKELFMGGIWAWVGFYGIGCEIKRKKMREKSTYSIKKRLLLALNAIVSFSEKPLYYLFFFGILVVTFSIIFAIYLLIKKILFPEYILTGYTSIMLVLIFSIGLNMLSIGLTGIYVGKIFNQVKNRPLFILREIY